MQKTANNINHTTMEKRTLNTVTNERLAQRIAHGEGAAVKAVAKLLEESKQSADYIVPMGNTRADNKLVFINNTTEMLMQVPDRQSETGYMSLTMHDNAIGQLAAKWGIPTRYLRDMASGDVMHKGLATRILNEHCGWATQTRGLVRTVAGEARAVLSENYRRLESAIILEAFMQQAQKAGALLADGHMDATRVYLEVLMPEPFAIQTANNGVVEIAFGARIQSSDYGDGALELRTFMMQGVCLNGMVRDSVLRQVHLGARLPDNIAISAETYRKDTDATASAVRDLTGSLFTPETIRLRAAEIQGASEIEVDAEQELKKLAKGPLLKDEAEKVGETLMRSNPEDGVTGACTLWKLTQAITATSRELEPRRSRDLQEVAGELMGRVKL